MKFCQFCGNQIEDTASFCGKCGNKVTPTTQQVVEDQPVVAQQPVVAEPPVPPVVRPVKQGSPFMKDLISIILNLFIKPFTTSKKLIDHKQGMGFAFIFIGLSSFIFGLFVFVVRLTSAINLGGMFGGLMGGLNILSAFLGLFLGILFIWVLAFALVGAIMLLATILKINIGFKDALSIVGVCCLVIVPFVFLAMFFSIFGFISYGFIQFGAIIKNLGMIAFIVLGLKLVDSKIEGDNEDVKTICLAGTFAALILISNIIASLSAISIF